MTAEGHFILDLVLLVALSALVSLLVARLLWLMSRPTYKARGKEAAGLLFDGEYRPGWVRAGKSYLYAASITRFEITRFLIWPMTRITQEGGWKITLFKMQDQAIALWDYIQSGGQS